MDGHGTHRGPGTHQGHLGPEKVAQRREGCAQLVTWSRAPAPPALPCWVSGVPSPGGAGWRGRAPCSLGRGLPGSICPITKGLCPSSPRAGADRKLAAAAQHPCQPGPCSRARLPGLAPGWARPVRSALVPTAAPGEDSWPRSTGQSAMLGLQARCLHRRLSSSQRSPGGGQARAHLLSLHPGRHWAPTRPMGCNACPLPPARQHLPRTLHCPVHPTGHLPIGTRLLCRPLFSVQPPGPPHKATLPEPAEPQG